ncbi:Bcr/CflA family multidrug efflux MFS transporter [uncultured Capnocytophaga sp.]|uniref:Bcr/CflA family multidrug efflux MFS transporter n=1 Tax=uncultured Capnocytophaga sp. TaxID=159273 RepID=UPI0028ED6653|nr:Bcr/CflA family multidrug efflux MFS transporter [uncultured Capnocytophaga sp.]
MKNYNTDILFILILGLLSMLTPLAIDMYLPSFGDIAQDLSVPKERIQTTLALFTLGFAFGQLLWGPLSDSFGRKLMILIGVLVAAFIALMLTQVDNIIHFYFLRFLQGFFGSAPAVVAGALLRDLFNKEAFSKMMSMVMMVTMIAPLVAPILGGYLADQFHWHSIFYLLSGLGFLSAFLVGFRIPESLPKERRIPLDLMGVLRNYRAVGTNKRVLGYIFTNAFSYSGMFCFLTSGSLVYTGVYGVAPKNFGYFFILNIGVMMVATFFSGRLVGKLGTERILRIGLLIQLIAGLWLALCALFHWGLWPVAFGVALYVGMVSVVSSNANAAVLELFPRTAGTANSLIGMFRFAIGAVIGAILAFFSAETEMPMLFAIALNILVAIVFYISLVRRQLRVL